MKYKNWDVRGFNRDEAVKLCNAGINPLVSVFLTSRGVTCPDKAKKLIDENESELHDPYLMKGMSEAVSRIRQAVANAEKVALYGDYDVDGMTSCALLALWLRTKNIEYDIYIPGRTDEGYGLNITALDFLKSRGASLVITSDCGVTAFEEADYAGKIGLDLIITDHHECKEQLPSAVAVVNPKRHDCSYPNKNLSGVGVVFKLLCALEQDCSSLSLLDTYSDLVAIGTIADVMSVLGENRTFIKHGLKRINQNPRLGLSKLLGNDINKDGTVDAVSIGYILAPKLNAPGRMGRSQLSIDLLLTEDENEANALAQELSQLNLDRRSLEAEILKEAEAALTKSTSVVDKPIVLASRGWYQGVAGIVAAKMAERYHLPAVIITIDKDGIGKGSCRSYGGFNIFSALSSCSDILTNFGGHEMAAGITIDEDKIDMLRAKLAELYSSTDSSDNPSLKLDFEVEKPQLLTVQNLLALNSLKPFGSGNLAPGLCVKNVKLSSLYPVGGGRHTKVKLQKADHMFDAIYFSMPTENLSFKDGDNVDIAFEPHINTFRGHSSVQLQIIDIRAAV